MIERIGWWSPARPHKWVLADTNGFSEEDIRDWAQEHPKHLFFFFSVSTDID